MPQLLSHIDDQGWLTPSMADVLAQGSTPPANDAVPREQALQLQQALAQQNTPVRILSVRLTPSYTLFIARPEKRGGRTAKPEDVRRSLGRIDKSSENWILGFMSAVADSRDDIGILLRTPDHAPLNLRRLIVQNTFRDHPSQLATILGVTFEQEQVIHDISSAPLLIIGDDAARQRFLANIFLTLIILNTPAELRYALAGSHSLAYETLSTSPHALGHQFHKLEDAQRLLDGMGKEIQRRRHWFSEYNVQNIAAYNTAIRGTSEIPLQNIVLLIDSLSDPDWQGSRERWLAPLYDLLIHGRSVGIHVILAANQMQEPDIPEIIRNANPTAIVLRSAMRSTLGNQLRDYQGALRFIDLFVRSDDEITPLETYHVTEDEIERAVSYWQQAAATQRAQDRSTMTITAELSRVIVPQTPATDAEATPTPPIPDRPPREAIERAAHAFSDTTATAEGTLARATALAAYLGWLGTGPLHDVLGLSTQQAREVMSQLRQNGVLADDDGPTPRFMRMADNPLKGDK